MAFQTPGNQGIVPKKTRAAQLDLWQNPRAVQRTPNVSSGLVGPKGLVLLHLLPVARSAGEQPPCWHSWGQGLKTFCVN